MAKNLLAEGSQVVPIPAFGNAQVIIAPLVLSANGSLDWNGQKVKVCVEGAERTPKAIVAYMTSQFCIPGKGTLTIKKLPYDCLSGATRANGKRVLVESRGQAELEFKVQTPAQQPPAGPGSPIPDPTRSYAGRGQMACRTLPPPA